MTLAEGPHLDGRAGVHFLLCDGRQSWGLCQLARDVNAFPAAAASAQGRLT